MTTMTPEDAVDALEAAHAQAIGALRKAVARFAETGIAPSPAERALFRYPELRVSYDGGGQGASTPRAYGQLIWPGEYDVSVTEPAFFRSYLLEQLHLLVADYGAQISVGTSQSEIPYTFVLDSSLDLDATPSADLARHFPVPRLALVGDAVVDGRRVERLDAARPLALFDAPRTDY